MKIKHSCMPSGNFDEINPNDLTEEMVLDAFKEEVRFIGTRIFTSRFFAFLALTGAQEKLMLVLSFVISFVLL